MKFEELPRHAAESPCPYQGEHNAKGDCAGAGCPAMQSGGLEAIEWQCPVTVLTDYLAAAGAARPSLSARRLLSEFGSLSTMFAAPSWRLRWVAGQRVAKIVSSSVALMKARLLEQVVEGPVVERTPVLIDFLQLEVGFLQHERLLALYVDAHSRLMRIETIGDGSVGNVVIDVRRIIACGLAVGASGLILVHNHPSGDPSPSRHDLAVTARLRALGEEVELHLLDHLIVARGRFGSIEDFWREASWAAGTE